MTKKPRVPGVLWKLFQNRARTLAETILSLIPQQSSATVQCRGKCSRHCLHCCCDGDRMSFLLREDDPSDYRKLLSQCFVVVSDNAPSPPPFDPRSHWSQLEIVQRTIEMISTFTKNMISTGYNKQTRSSIILEALTSPSWSLLLKRVGDGLMIYLLKYSSIFIPLHRKKHNQVTGTPINDLCWNLLKHTSNSNIHQPSSVQKLPEEVESISITIKNTENSVTPLKTTQENRVLGVTESRKRSRSYAWQRRHTRRKLSNQITSPQVKMKVPCSCCSIWNSLEKVPTQVQISKQSILYKLERASSILPGKHIINSLKPNVAGANALFKEIFGSTPQSTVCSHSNEICPTGTTCLYHSLHKLLKILIRKAINCPRLKILKKHIFIKPSSDHKDLHCSKGQVVSFIWAASRSIVPHELLGSWRILRKNISKFIKLRIYEKFSLHQCMHKLKTSNFFCNIDQKFGEVKVKQRLFERWIYWFFTNLIVPLIQANFYVTETEHGKLDVFFYEKSVWENLMKSSVSNLQEKCYSLLDLKNVTKIISKRTFGFSRVRFSPKPNGIRPLANLKQPSRLPKINRQFKSVNVVLRDLHATLKDIQVEKPEKLGSSVFSYNDVHRKIREFLTRVRRGLDDGFPCVYMVVADVQKAYDSIDQDKLLDVMKDVITDDHILHQTQIVTISKRKMQICQNVNLSRQFRSFLRSPSSHSILVDTGRKKTARKDELLFNLQQHVKYNVLKIDKDFYLQNVGIPQGSILSSLLCSFYYGHMENSKIVPFVNKVTEMGSAGGYFGQNNLLMRFIDDFLFISTSKKQALALLSRLERGFFEYNCDMNKEKFGLSFDDDKIRVSSNRVYIDENGNKFLKWSGLFINCKTLEVQADYTRYLDVHISSTLTVSWQGNPIGHLREKLCNYLRPKCHAIFYDSNINSEAVVRLNIYQAFLICAMKFHCYVSDLIDICKFDSGSVINIIHNSLRFMYKLMKKRMFSVVGDESLRPILKVKRKEVEWLGLRGYFEVLKRKEGRYKEVLCLLEMKLKSFNEVERVSHALRFAVDKSNSSILWKIKY
ncbi:hypothetical protein L1887_14871 [Cichorium endivia]|nr:hypothetical protein L1887_14871 [Cichorium endivia]